MVLKSRYISKKKIVIASALVVLIVLVIGCAVMQQRHIERTYYGKVVREVPDGFVHLQNNLKNGMRTVGFESRITFMDADGNSFFSTGFGYSDFIVRYNNEYYVNEEKLLELIEVAGIVSEQRHKTYNLGDFIEVRGAGETVYTVQIISVEAGATEPFANDILTTYNIKYYMSSNASGYEHIISMVETKQRVEYSSFDYIDSENIGVKIRLRGDDTIEAIILSSPTFPGLIYRVVVSD